MVWDLNFVEGDGISIQVGANPADPDVTDVEIASTVEAGGDPADDTLVWMPLSTVVAGVPELVWDADDSLIPTLTPI